jgi:hypothetical protein
MNVILLKHGTKYTSEDVNKLVKQLEPYFDNIYCFTEDPEGLECEHVIIPEKPRLNKWWNKLQLFSDDFPIKGKCVLFDIDIKVNFDPKPYLVWNKGITVVSAYYKREIPRYYTKHKYNTVYNSSIITWETGTVGYIWDHFLTNKDYFMRKYKGIDRFLMWEDIKFDTFEDGIMNHLSYTPYPEPCPIDHGTHADGLSETILQNK